MSQIYYQSGFVGLSPDACSLRGDAAPADKLQNLAATAAARAKIAGNMLVDVERIAGLGDDWLAKASAEIEDKQLAWLKSTMEERRQNGEPVLSAEECVQAMREHAAKMRCV